MTVSIAPYKASSNYTEGAFGLPLADIICIICIAYGATGPRSTSCRRRKWDLDFLRPILLPNPAGCTALA